MQKATASRSYLQNRCRCIGQSASHSQ